MALPEGERIARLETLAEELRREIMELTTETQRTRQRLHGLEGTAAGVRLMTEEGRRKEQTQYRRLELRLQVLTAVIAAAAVVVPIVVVYLTNH